ncbi:hypothetical protein NE237_009754 [Protea cynaroides]|uniref:Uncharacterized protein n=1 Tax=Protea cynaroides TaxID=273540 RepID=A0A9Q0R0Y1_9MAGN|nr:hypothetical protein NE237_009754 [Protea cynaroides]
MEEEEEGKNSTDPALKVMENLADDSSISTLLQNRTSTNLHGRRPLPVGKINPSSHHVPTIAPSPSHPSIHGPSPGPVSPNLNRPLQKKTKPHAQSFRRELGQNGSPPCTPKSGPISDAPRSSSIGHTPYPSHISSISHSKQTNIHSYPLIPSPYSNSALKNYRSFSSDLPESMMAPAIIKPPENSENAVEDVEEDEVLEEVAERKWGEERKKGSKSAFGSEFSNKGDRDLGRPGRIVKGP